jgi:cytochrome c-type biogenesis protein CcmH/NrfF
MCWFVAAPSGAQETDRARAVGKKVRCMCGGCNDTASTCYHVGGEFSGPCGKATAELKTIRERLDKGDSEDLILQSFIQEFGPTAYVEPPHSGFGQVAWAMPVVYLVVGLGLVLLVINRWRKRPALAPEVPTTAGSARFSAEALERARERVAHETED